MLRPDIESHMVMRFRDHHFRAATMGPVLIIEWRKLSAERKG